MTREDIEKYQGMRVRVQLRYSTRYRSDLGTHITGQLVAVAKRWTGAAGWMGQQYDVVLYDKPARQVWTVPITRVETIKLEEAT